jgi:endoglycosylceramidase
MAAVISSAGMGALPGLATPATAVAAADAAVAMPVSPIGHAGRWMLDGRGRVVIVHGVNMSVKQLPAYPAALGFDDDDAAFLASQGFNAVRITVERYAVEPAPGQFDGAYIAHIADTVKTLARHGVLSLIDFHQDEYGPVFYDNGYPGWMTITDGLPNVFEVGFPLQYLLNPALERAFDHLWANDTGSDGKPLQTDDAGILSYVARGLRGLTGLLGYEILNEPWPGSAYPTCIVAGVGCPLFDRGPVSAYYQRMISALRAADGTQLIWYEPLVTFNYSIPTSVVPPADPKLGFAFHDYALCSATGDAGLPISPGGACSTEDSLVLDNAIGYSTATRTALLETEFGATFDTATLNQELGQYDQRMVPWMFWSYTRYIDKLASDGTLLPPTGANVNQAMVATLARPYPQLVAGTPTAWSFDPTTHVLSFTYSTTRARGTGSFAPGSETDIALPAIQYPTGYDVSVRGASAISGPRASILRVVSHAHAAAVTVTVAPGPLH